MNNKKIIIFSNYDDMKNPYYGGGGATAIHEVAKRLTPDNDVTVITGNFPGAKNETIDNVTYQRIGFPNAGSQLGQLLFQLSLPFFAMRKRYDLWIESFTPPFSTAYLQLFTKKPVVGLAHFLSGEDMWRKYRIPFFLVEYFGLKTYRQFIVTTENLKQAIRKINSKANIETIFNAIPEEAIHQDISENEKHILFLGRIEVNQKGLDLLLRAYKKICSQISYPLVIAGSGRNVDERLLQNEIKKLDLENNVRFVGRVDGKQKKQIMNNAIFLVVPSRYESFGIVVLEAFAAAKPVIVFDTQQLTWIPDELSLKAKPFDYDDLADQMLRLIRTPKLRKSMGKKAKEFVKNFNWNTIFLKYQNFFSVLLDNAFNRN